MKFYTMYPVAVLLILAVTACSAATAPRTSVNYDQSFNFSGVKTIYIEPSSRTNAATIMVTDAQIRRIDAAIAAELTRKGLEVVATSRQADLFLSWYLVTDNPNAVSGRVCEGCGSSAGDNAQYSKGTLIVDMTDPMRNRAVWRSILQTELVQAGSAPTDEARRAAAVAVFARFPPP